MTQSELLKFLYVALDSPLGIVVETPNVERLRHRLYALRRKAKDDKLASLALVPSPNNDTQLWIVKKSRGSSNGTERGDPAAESDAVALRGRL